MLDKTDIKLLRRLQQDASLSLADLAEAIGLSRSACGRRLQRLDSEGYIRGTVMLLNADKAGLPLTVFVNIKTNQHNAEWSAAFQALIDSLPGVQEVYRMTGTTDYLLKAVVADMQGYDALYQRLITADLLDVSAGFVMEEMKFTTALPL